nr:hypothetical protein [Tanacetum cinerariifolium]
MDPKFVIASQTCTLTNEQLTQFIQDFDIPQDVKIILTKRSQTIFDAPLGYVDLYTHHFSLSNLRLPIISFICKVLNYFKVHISCFNPFGMVKLTTFAVMCRAYVGELTVNLLCSFLNLGRAGDWLTLSNREMDFKSFMMQEIDDVADSDDASAWDNENSLVVTSMPPLPEAGKKFISLDKRKLPFRVGDSLLEVRKMAAQSSKVAGEASVPLDVDKFPLAKEVKDSAECHWVVVHVTPPSWKKHLRQISIKQLGDIHDRAYMRQVVLDNDIAYAELERKCNEALLDLDKNPLVANMRNEIETLQRRVDGLHNECTRLDRASVVAKVVPDAATKLIRSDEMGMLVAKLVKASIIYGRCAAFEEVSKLKKPFVMKKVASYRPSSKQEYDQARRWRMRSKPSYVKAK